MPWPNPDTQFKPGNNANPGGRPKGRSITSRLRDLLEATEIGGKPLPNGKQIADLVVEALVKQCIKGHPKCLDMVMDRAEGKVQEHLDLTSNGQPLQPVFQRVDNSRDDSLRITAETNGVQHE